jgi:hypothetical protein
MRRRPVARAHGPADAWQFIRNERGAHNARRVLAQGSVIRMYAEEVEFAHLLIDSKQKGERR